VNTLSASALNHQVRWRAGLSFILGLFMCITWLLNPRKRKFPAFVPFWLALCSLMNAGSILLSVLVGGNPLTFTFPEWLSPHPHMHNRAEEDDVYVG
jgi:hypothetical protein